MVVYSSKQPPPPPLSDVLFEWPLTNFKGYSKLQCFYDSVCILSISRKSSILIQNEKGEMEWWNEIHYYDTDDPVVTTSEP